MQVAASRKNKMKKVITVPIDCIPLNCPKTSIQVKENPKTEYTFLELTRHEVGGPNSKYLVVGT